MDVRPVRTQMTSRRKSKAPTPAKAAQPPVPQAKAAQPPVVVALPNTSNQKMAAIVELSKAVANLATALASAHVDVEISGCNFADCQMGDQYSNQSETMRRTSSLTSVRGGCVLTRLTATSYASQQRP